MRRGRIKFARVAELERQDATEDGRDNGEEGWSIR